MPEYEDKPGQFVLFRNAKKKNPKGPDWGGHIIKDDGTKQKIAAWDRRNGEIVSGSFDNYEPPANRSGGSMGDDIPF